ncbi:MULTISPECIES: GntR family transcriptional regulator [unclassified Achromobacter]|uniref:GntR family transcriptional regulator n=1 Tax=unclassified Achromobacter TaxID=2626865 RepID=UPI000B51DD32|nr:MULTISPECIES: GntR family transcriptional regulator [unclassified Achromobacter]OWT69140.1 GntR family transcriptional regulator [Achromobacter sp. HZ34]OWT70545.1 GntR family transcriptional regulator [Achromobacter sp. HZ28]
MNLPARSAPGGDRKLVRRTTVDLVLDELRQQVLSGRLRPGEPLRQEALADELGVSRIPVREAIRRLEAEGLVSIHAHRGAYVIPLSTSEVVQTFELRMQVEPWLFGAAIEARGTGRFKEARTALAGMLHADAASWGELNWQFHEILYRPAERELAMNMLKQLHDRGDRYLRFQVVNVPLRQQAHAEHQALIEYAEQGQVEAAVRALREHIRVALEQVLHVVADLTQNDPAITVG